MTTTTQVLTIPCLKLTQPIGEFFIGSIKARDLCEVTQYDFRRLTTEVGFESYLGIQREVSKRREREIAKYVGTKDACFPTAVILAIPGECVQYNSRQNTLTLSPYTDDPDVNNHVTYDKIAVVLDGQHRIAGLKTGSFEGDYEINVSIFVDIDIADQAYIFSTVNLAQTKVNKSLVYDLFDLAKKRSPQKTCHNIAVALDRDKASPFHQTIKRLGVSTAGRFNETITQSTFVQSLLRYISIDPVADRDAYMRNKKPPLVDDAELRSLIFRNMFIQEKDLQITDVIWNYFDTVKMRWPKAWEESATGLMLNRTNGFKALMRFLRPCYLHLAKPGQVLQSSDFERVFKKIDFKDNHFNTDEYKPGSSGEGKLYRTLLAKSRLSE